jgi:hypothetical protein
MKIFGIFYGHLVYFVAVWYILWLFGMFYPFWYVVPRKIWQPFRCPREITEIKFSAIFSALVERAAFAVDHRQRKVTQRSGGSLHWTGDQNGFLLFIV